MKSWLNYLKQGLSRKPPEDRIAGEKGYTGLRSNLKNLLPFFKRHWRKGVLGVFLILFTLLLTFPQPLITRYLIDNVILARNLHLLIGTILLLAGVLIGQMLAGTLQDFYFSRFEQIVILDIQHKLLKRALRFPKAFFDANKTGYLMSRLSSDVQGLRWFFSSTIVYIASNTLRFIGGTALLFYLEWRLAIGVVGLIPILVFTVRYFSQKIHTLSHQNMEQRARVSSEFQESLSSVSLIKAFSSEGRTLRRLMSSLKSAFHISLEQTSVNSITNLAISTVPNIARGVVLGLGAYWIITDQWTLGSLLAFQSYMGYVFGPAQFLATANIGLQNARAGLERVSALFDIVPEDKGAGKRVERLRGAIDFKNVSFSYNKREPVLNDVSFSIRPGEHVAVVGPSGVGKTTLLSLILRFYQPTAGEILFDGQRASDFKVSSLRKRIGYVSQSTLLLSGTVIENLRYGNHKASEEEVVRAARLAGIHDFIQGLPGGYDTEIGEKGVNLSEGQKQRLSIARALVMEPDILVLDEPTSALDGKTEKSIIDSLPSVVRDKTLIVVSSHLSTIRDSDYIFLLNESRLVATGTHHSLWQSNDYYRELVGRSQE